MTQIKMPPSLEEVLAAGYSEEAAKQIVAEEESKWLAGLPPYDQPNPSAEDLDQVAAEQKAAEETGPATQESPSNKIDEPATIEKLVDELADIAAEGQHPQATPAAHPPQEPSEDPADLHQTAPPSLANPTSHGTAVLGGPHNPSLDTEKYDSRGNEKKDPGPFGPRGAFVSPEHLTEVQRDQRAAAEAKRLQRGMSSSDHVDSIGQVKGEHYVVERGRDEHGMRRPDEVIRHEEPQPEHLQVGPRGKGIPKDSFRK